ncbi:hypothetical protein QKU48_gp1093 [Fadolivirus algeromassiliense]|jgi:hypothetical protein|uniref:Uncharacterized protein n=1 Tax=Fadolivirus FV1/VV64 TaxID=3070911 RepID=A0A7D3UV03_9VIRU|nr:hypothetical protein QKU48_gp1093 [Fadolivirus algeromassiliense]QKF94551.1 hypothetical protein Fadolivirus_1_1093 [Fadolivirus FV1/VV64]
MLCCIDSDSSEEQYITSYIDKHANHHPIINITDEDYQLALHFFYLDTTQNVIHKHNNKFCYKHSCNNIVLKKMNYIKINGKTIIVISYQRTGCTLNYELFIDLNNNTILTAHAFGKC